MTRSIELVFFQGCPNAGRARENLRAALESLSLPPVWTEWDQQDPTVPDRLRGYGSPTILVDGADITGTDAAGGTALACRADGVPGTDIIARALR